MADVIAMVADVIATFFFFFFLSNSKNYCSVLEKISKIKVEVCLTISRKESQYIKHERLCAYESI